MTWATPYTFAAFEVLTNTMLNAIQTNILETAPAKVTTAGDIVYATGANALARLGIGSAGQVLRANAAATAPEWGSHDVQTANVDSNQTTTSTSWADLTTVGPTINLTVGPSGKALIILTAQITSSSASFIAIMGIGVDGADPTGVHRLGNNNTDSINASFAKLFTGLTLGSHEFKAKYLVSGGTGSFNKRVIEGVAL